MQSRSVVHIDLDTFFVSCERILDSRLNNRPVIVGGTTDRGVVAACSYEARAYGVYSSMPMRLAKQLCPEAIIIRGNSGTYSKFSDTITEIIQECSPTYEKSSIDEFYIDTSGMDRFYGCYKWAIELRKKIIEETHLPISFGLSTSKTVAKILTGEAKPNNHKQVVKGREKAFLAPLSVRKIPMVGDQTYKKLRGMGVEQVKTIQEMPVELMDRLMGKHGISLWKKARGIDNSPIVPYQERKSISIERTFEKDTSNLNKLRSIVLAMTENLAYQLRNGSKLTACISIKIRYSDFQTSSKQKRIPYTSSDSKLIEIANELFDQLYDRRVLIRLVGVRFSHLVGGNYQINLFEDTEEMIRLYQAMDRIRNVYGQDAIKRAVAMGSKRIGRTNPFDGRPPVIPAHRRA